MPARFPRLGVVYVQSHQPPPHLATIRNIFRGSIHISNQPWSIHSPERDTEAQIRAACEVWKESHYTFHLCQVVERAPETSDSCINDANYTLLQLQIAKQPQSGMHGKKYFK